ncbi:MAG: NAD(P)/FAD-dependent oxidoreductase [Spartobacteria bacterium]|nr:NAD(P)/FAD-dependent oxidoreductase [Spartobacteria bacterium]
MTARYDDIVVGSGMGGLSAALLLGMIGRKVLLLEKAPRIGGCMQSFQRRGVTFDVGFHFTGGLAAGGLLDQAFRLFGVRDALCPEFTQSRSASRLVFKSDGRVYDLPAGEAAYRSGCKHYLPEEARAIDHYFEMVHCVCDHSPGMAFDRLDTFGHGLAEDFISLRDVLDGLSDNVRLKTLLSAYGLCYGVRPSQISFANHARITLGLYESLARIDRGGQAIVEAFCQQLEQYDVEIRCNTHIEELADVSRERANRFVLNSGDELEAERCIFTIHPEEIMKLLPAQRVSKAFRNRVNAYEPSIGFFTVYACSQPCADLSLNGAVIELLCTDDDLEKSFDADSSSDRTLMLLHHSDNGRQIMNVSEIAFREDVAAWQHSSIGRRPSGYYDYKMKKTDAIRARILERYPACRASLEIMESASMLTYRDYLSTPYGAVYGVKQKIGQFSLFGKLPVRNLYAAGQSAGLPGVLGVIMTSVLVVRGIIGPPAFAALVKERL